MSALTVSSSIVGTTMGRTFSAVPYTYLKRGVYYFVRRIPSDLQTFYRTDRVTLSLRTKSLHRASRASERLSSRLMVSPSVLFITQTKLDENPKYADVIR